MSITHQDETFHTAPHRRVERILSRMQLSYTIEEPFRPYSVDIYLPEWHLGVEVDGPGHSPKKDAIRDEVLMTKYFLPILRLKSDLGVNKIMTDVEDFIVKWAASGQERKNQYTSLL